MFPNGFLILSFFLLFGSPRLYYIPFIDLAPTFGFRYLPVRFLLGSPLFALGLLLFSYSLSLCFPLHFPFARAFCVCIIAGRSGPSSHLVGATQKSMSDFLPSDSASNPLSGSDLARRAPPALDGAPQQPFLCTPPGLQQEPGRDHNVF